MKMRKDTRPRIQRSRLAERASNEGDSVPPQRFLSEQGEVKVMSQEQPQPGLIDALVEVGRERQRILTNLRTAYEAHDIDGILHYVGEIVGVEEKLEEASREKCH